MALFLKVGICSALLVMSVINVNGQCQGGSTHSTTAQSTSTSYIASDNYPSYYRNNIYCTTTITNPGSGRILFHVEHQDIERRYDFLYIYIGSVSSANRRHYSENQYSGSVGLTNPGEDLIVRFTSDSSITYGGYKVNFIAIENLGSCGTTITATSTEQQLSYVYSWQYSSPCAYTISSQNVGDSVQITVLFAKGIVQISEASAVTNLETSGSTYVSTQDTITVTGTYGNDFVVMYESTSSATAGTVTAAPVIRNEDSSICYERQKTAVFNTRFLYSPNYPSRYPNDVDCTVTLVADDSAKSITLTVNDYTVLVYDDLRIYDGDDTSFNEIPLTTTESMTSSGASITLRFVTDYTSTARGFNISYSSVTRVGPTCLGNSVTASTADDTEQNIMSPNYPSSYSKYVFFVSPLRSSGDI
ncbi:deleted in malignant brain tumors 1 protein-like [Ruditapes philippinarum]|uniref:deleted in malignant brain tumors 1 protein-like n=1 Tax=Ruditapes philippinarum TaxID=129788 RepID=UPI00295C1942|nr:deleted in malignant brain tumors 1 protein-like [Ruditapes philippinarum]